MWAPESARNKVLIVAALTALTLSVHYHEWTITPLFGHVHWLHAIHGRLCYIPIVFAASWFGLRGGLYTAAAISVLVLPYIIGARYPQDFVSEIAEIVFYFAIATMIGVLVDREYTARRRQQNAQLQMERSQKLSAVGQLAAGVAHEIKNPLASIKGAADILTDDDTSREEREEFKGILRNEVRRIDATVTEFLEFARPKESHFEAVDLGEAVGATVRQAEAHSRRQGLSIETDLPEGIVVEGDREKLHQMTLNLLLNAIQASETGATIRVSLRGDGAATLTIADEGSGITRDDMEHIFDPFFTRRASGIGLGLAIVKDIVESHSGEIRLDSDEGRGTTATVTLPRKR